MRYKELTRKRDQFLSVFCTFVRTEIQKNLCKNLIFSKLQSLKNSVYSSESFSLSILYYYL
jgi:hypothetical protein